MEVLKDKRDMFGVDFDKNKEALNEISTIRSKILRNELAGYITKFIKNELRNEEDKTKAVESEEEILEETAHTEDTETIEETISQDGDVQVTSPAEEELLFTPDKRRKTVNYTTEENPKDEPVVENAPAEKVQD